MVRVKREAKVYSLLELCEKEEWEVIINSAPEKIFSWDFKEKNEDGENPSQICLNKKANDNVLHFINYYESITSNNKPMQLSEAKRGHLSTLKWLLANGHSINERDKNGNSCGIMKEKHVFYWLHCMTVWKHVFYW